MNAFIFSTIDETRTSTTTITSAAESALHNQRAFPLVRSRTVADLGRKKPNRNPHDNPQLPPVFETELKLSEKSKTFVQLEDSKVQFSENLPKIEGECSVAENFDPNNSDFKRRPFSPQRSDENFVQKSDEKFVLKSDENFVRKNTAAQHSTGKKLPTEGKKSESALRDIAVLRRHPELLFPKMTALSASYDPLVLEDVIQLGKEELKDMRNDAMNEIFMDRSASRKDIVKSPRKEKRQNVVLNSNAQNFLGSTILDLERKRAEQLKLIERLSCSLPEELAETARDQIRQMTNTGAICEWKDKMRLEHREIQQEDRKKDPRWQKLESSLCDTHGVRQKWQKVCKKKLWMLL